MTLVVAAVHDTDRITMASDTLITWDDDVARPPEQSSLAKLVILRADVAVGVAGKDPHGRLRDLDALRNEPVDLILEQLREDTVAGFVVSALAPTRLWEVLEGQVRERTERGFAWDGDPSAHEDFARRYAEEWMNTSSADDIPFRVMTAMQALTTFRPVRTVGGITLRVGTDNDGFHFIADRGQILFGPAWVVFVGTGTTRGAVGILDLQLGLGQLFRSEAPDAPVTIVASTPEEFVAIALSQGQSIVFASPPA